MVGSARGHSTSMCHQAAFSLHSISRFYVTQTIHWMPQPGGSLASLPVSNVYIQNSCGKWWKKAETREPLCLTLVSVAPSGFELFWHVLNMTHQCICSQSYRYIWICWRPKQPTNPSNILTSHQDRNPLVLPGYWRSKVTNKNHQTSSKTKVHRLNGPKSSMRITSNHHASQDMKSSQHHPKKSSNSENINPEITSNQKIIRKSSENHQNIIRKSSENHHQT
jgi:hypothetical protein